jgi:hypothetical protein
MTYLKVETLATAPADYFASLLYKMEYISDHTLHEFCPYFGLFTLAGIFFLYKSAKVLCLTALGLLALVLFTNILYLQADPIEYWHIADHMLTNNWVIGFLGCAGMFWLISKMSPVWMHLALLIIFFMLPFAYLNAIQTNNQTRQFLYVGYGLTALKSLPRDAIYFSEADYDYFSTLFLTETLRLRPDIHLILSPFLNKPYQFENVLLKDAPLFAESETADTYGEAQVFKALNDSRTGPPVFCTFPNAYFSQLYLKFNPTLRFEPQGILTHVLRPDEKPQYKSSFPLLFEFYDHYLAPEISQPNGINGLLREICVHPLLNSSRYETLLGNTQHRNWYYCVALELISEQDFTIRSCGNLNGIRTFKLKGPPDGIGCSWNVALHGPSRSSGR